MSKKKPRNTKSKIIAAAWKLFYEQGYEETTVEDIIFESETSKGSFYHYFDGKDALLSSLSVLFDERYEELMQQEHGDMDCIGLLRWLNYELFVTIDNTVSIELLSRLFSSQLVTKGERHLLSRNRTYYKLLRQIITQGQENGELTTACEGGYEPFSYVNEDGDSGYDVGFIFRVCLSFSGEYSLSQYTKTMMPMFLEGFRKK